MTISWCEYTWNTILEYLMEPNQLIFMALQNEYVDPSHSYIRYMLMLIFIRPQIFFLFNYKNIIGDRN